MIQELSGVATETDISIVKGYIEDFTKQFESYKGGGQELFQTAPLEHAYLLDISQRNLGKLQLSEPRGTLASDPKAELTYLFKTFISERYQQQPERTKKSRLKTDLKKELGQRNLLLKGESTRKDVGFKADVRIKSKHSGVEHQVDFAMRNGRLSVIETIDMRKNDEKEIEHEAFSAALKLDDLSRSFRGKLDGFAVVAAPANPERDLDYFLKVLRAYSEVVLYYDRRQRGSFIRKVEKIAGHRGLVD